MLQLPFLSLHSTPRILFSTISREAEKELKQEQWQLFSYYQDILPLKRTISFFLLFYYELQIINNYQTIDEIAKKYFVARLTFITVGYGIGIASRFCRTTTQKQV
jgi:hypothetical protein